jgi:hypothetical protein
MLMEWSILCLLSLRRLGNSGEGEMNNRASGLGSCIDEFLRGRLGRGRSIGPGGPVGETRGDGEVGIELRLLLIDSTGPGEAV